MEERLKHGPSSASWIINSLTWYFRKSGGGAAGGVLEGANWCPRNRRSTGGGGGGGYVSRVINVGPGAEINYMVGAGGTAGTGDQAAGGAGAPGRIEIEYTPACTPPTITCPANTTVNNTPGYATL
jgi:hypothetical protein